MFVFCLCSSVCLDVKVCAKFVCAFMRESVWCVCDFANVRVCVRMCECMSESAVMGVPVGESVCGMFLSVRACEYTRG